MTTKNTLKWSWKMDYCKKQEIPPAQKWAWDLAEKMYTIFIGGNNGE